MIVSSNTNNYEKASYAVRTTAFFFSKDFPSVEFAALGTQVSFGIKPCCCIRWPWIQISWAKICAPSGERVKMWAMISTGLSTFAWFPNMCSTQWAQWGVGTVEPRYLGTEGLDVEFIWDWLHCVDSRSKWKIIGILLVCYWYVTGMLLWYVSLPEITVLSPSKSMGFMNFHVKQPVHRPCCSPVQPWKLTLTEALNLYGEGSALLPHELVYGMPVIFQHQDSVIFQHNSVKSSTEFSLPPRRDAGSFGTLTHISAPTRIFTFIGYLFFEWIYDME